MHPSAADRAARVRRYHSVGGGPVLAGELAQVKEVHRALKHLLRRDGVRPMRIPTPTYTHAAGTGLCTCRKERIKPFSRSCDTLAFTWNGTHARALPGRTRTHTNTVWK